MKLFIVILSAIVLTACNETSSADKASSTPGQAPDSSVPSIVQPVLTPDVIPVVTTPIVVPDVPVVAPVVVVPPVVQPPVVVPPVVPVAPAVPTTATKTQSFGGYTCALLSTGNVWCSDGTNAVTTTNGNFVDMVVGNGVACALQIQNPPYANVVPSNCSQLTGCAKPATYYGAYCWAPTSTAPIAMQTQLQITPQISLSTWISGPRLLSIDVNNRACITQDVFDLHSVNYPRTNSIAVCGTTVTSNGRLN